MNYAQILEAIISLMLALPVVLNLSIVLTRDRAPKLAYWLMRVSPLAVAVAQAPRERMLETAAKGLVDLVKDSPLPESEPASIAAQKLEAIVASDATKSPTLPPAASTFLLLVVFGGTLGGCAASEKLIETLHDVEDLNDAQTQIANEAKPCFEAEANRDELACSGEAICVAKVRAKANARADLLDTAHAKQCKLNPLLVGCPALKVPQ